MLLPYVGRIGALSQKPSRQTMLRIGQGILLGVGMALGHAPLGLWPVALAALYFGLRFVLGADSAKQSFVRGLWLGVGYFAFALQWIVQPFLIDPLHYAWMAPFALLGMSIGFGLFWGAAAWAARRLQGGAVILALCLALAEMLRSTILTGFPWALLGHIWVDTPLVQTASLWGAHGLSLMTLLAVAIPLSFGWRGLIAPVLIVGLAGGWSWMRLSLPQPALRDGVVRIVQPNIEQSLKWDPQEARANFTTLLAMSEDSGADLVIWPETAVPYLLNEGEGAALAIADAAGAAQIAVGLQRDEGEQAWNSLAVIGPDGFISQHFDKMHLVPFGEYIPFGDVLYQAFGLRAFASQAGAGYLPGQQRELLNFGALGRALPVICYEAIFATEIMPDSRPDWIVQITNDAWFGTWSGPYQHLAQARLRAIEQGLPLVRVANTGVSAVIDARGQIAPDQMLGLGQQGVINAQLPGALSVTPYLLLRDHPLWLFIIVFLGVALFRARGKAVA